MKADEFIREVDEAVRQERWVGLWKAYGPYIIGGAIALVVGTAAGVGWREYRESQRLAEARQFAAAVELMQANRAAEAAAAFETLAAAADTGYGLLARLRAAEAEAEAGNAAQKTSILDSLAENDDVDALYRDLGRVLAAQARLDDDADPDNVAARLGALTEPESPWRYSALELEALALMRSGDTAAARERLEQLVGDPAAPANLVQRASELLASLGGPVDAAGTADDSTATSE